MVHNDHQLVLRQLTNLMVVPEVPLIKAVLVRKPISKDVQVAYSNPSSKAAVLSILAEDLDLLPVALSNRGSNRARVILRPLIKVSFTLTNQGTKAGTGSNHQSVNAGVWCPPPHSNDFYAFRLFSLPCFLSLCASSDPYISVFIQSSAYNVHYSSKK